MLSEETKRKIEQEEMSNLAPRYSNNNNTSKPLVSKKILIIAILVLFVLPVFVGLFTSDTEKEPTDYKQSNAKPSTELPVKSAPSPQDIATVSEKFCSERQGEYSYDMFFCGACIDLATIIDVFEAPPGQQVTIKNADNPATNEECDKLADLCVETWDVKTCSDIADSKIWIGMNKLQLEISMGVPDDKNDTVTSYGVHTQWVYGDFGPYIYLEGSNYNDLVVTSWQD